MKISPTDTESKREDIDVAIYNMLGFEQSGVFVVYVPSSR